MQKTVFSGMRPTGKLHFGHWVGALGNWVTLQESFRCIFSIVDWHALMGEYETSHAISSYIREMAIDWLACGIDPKRSLVFVQSEVPQHLELQMIFSCITPLGWLERNPTYKEQLREIKTRDLQTYGFLGYPVLQAADILLYKADAVPIGEDQLPHLELTREIARRFNFIFKTEFFSDCASILTEVPRLLGLDGRKMSKSYSNAINLADTDAEILAKVRSMFTDPQRQRLTDPGHPKECNVYAYYEVFAPQVAPEACCRCAQATKGCTQCKAELAGLLIEYLKPIQQKRSEIVKNKDYVDDVLAEGRIKATAIAAENIKQIKEIVFHGI